MDFIIRPQRLIMSITVITNASSRSGFEAKIHEYSWNMRMSWLIPSSISMISLTRFADVFDT